MTSLESTQGRAERLTAGTRFVLACSCFLAIYLDPMEPSKAEHVAYTLLAAYVVYAAAIGILTWRASEVDQPVRIVTHVLDLAVFSWLMFLTEGPTSPFFLFFVFSLFSATIRFGRRATIWTAVAAVSIYLGMGILATIIGDAALPLNQFIIRSAYLVLVAVLLYYLAAYLERLRHERARVAAWPAANTATFLDLIFEMLARATDVLRCERALLVWEDEEEPWLFLASAGRNREFWSGREPPATYDPLVPEPLEDRAFLCRDAARPQAAVWVDDGRGGIEIFRGSPVHPALQARFAIRSVFSHFLTGRRFRGRLFILDGSEMTTDQMMMGSMVSDLIVMRIDERQLLEQVRKSAASEERVKVARDLHDGVQQALAGMALQLESVRLVLEQSGDNDGMLASVTEIQKALAINQEEINAFVSELRPGGGTRHSWADALERMPERFQAQWGLRVELAGHPSDLHLDSELGMQVYRIAGEAVANAAKHAEATCVRVAVERSRDHVCIDVTDDGKGFPFHGRFTLRELTAMRRGPVTLKERISALGGELVLESSPTGSHLEIIIPLGGEERS